MRRRLMMAGGLPMTYAQVASFTGVTSTALDVQCSSDGRYVMVSSHILLAENGSLAAMLSIPDIQNMGGVGMHPSGEYAIAFGTDGVAYRLYTRSGSAWTERNTLIPPDPVWNNGRIRLFADSDYIITGFTSLESFLNPSDGRLLVREGNVLNDASGRGIWTILDGPGPIIDGTDNMSYFFGKHGNGMVSFGRSTFIYFGNFLSPPNYPYTANVTNLIAFCCDKTATNIYAISHLSQNTMLYKVARSGSAITNSNTIATFYGSSGHICCSRDGRRVFVASNYNGTDTLRVFVGETKRQEIVINDAVSGICCDETGENIFITHGYPTRCLHFKAQ